MLITNPTGYQAPAVSLVVKVRGSVVSPVFESYQAAQSFISTLNESDRAYAVVANIDSRTNQEILYG